MEPWQARQFLECSETRSSFVRSPPLHSSIVILKWSMLRIKLCVRHCPDQVLRLLAVLNDILLCLETGNRHRFDRKSPNQDCCDDCTLKFGRERLDDSVQE